MLAISSDPVLRSSLEEMLVSLQRTDGVFENPESCKPPSLPARPRPNSRARPPSSTKRRVAGDLDVAERQVSSHLNNGLGKSIFRFQAKEIETGESPEPVSTSASDMGGRISRLENRSSEFLNDVRQTAFQGNLDEHCNSNDAKEVVTALQSYVRGEMARKEFRRSLRKPDDCNKSHNDKQDHQLVATAVLIQSVIRGCLARRRQHFTRLHSLTTPPYKAQDVVPPQPEVVEELQKRVIMAEAALEEKDKEVAVLKEQVDQLESKMKAMEAMWQKKMYFLQMSLDAAKKNAADAGNEPRTHRNRARSPVTFMDILFGENNASASKSIANGFEKQKQALDHEPQAIVEAKQNHSPSALKPPEEVETLKHEFDAWKKDFGLRLSEARAKASRMGPQEGEKQRWRWWGLKRRRS